MAIELTTTNLEEIRKIAEDFLMKSENAETVDQKRHFESDLEEVINYYSAVSKKACYSAAKQSGDPMRYAILTFYYPAIKIKEAEDKETGTIIRSIVDAVRPIDLGDMYKKLGGIGVDKNWLYSAERFNYHLSLRGAERIGATIQKENFYMNEISHQLDMGKDPCSNTQLLKTLNLVIHQMIGEQYNATSHDRNYLVDVYVNDNKKSKTGVSAANHKTLRNYLKKVCYRILTNGTGYELEQREIKTK